jgi:hypothetical protein
MVSVKKTAFHQEKLAFENLAIFVGGGWVDRYSFFCLSVFYF